MNKPLRIAAAILALSLTAAGCGKDQPAPGATQPPSVVTEPVATDPAPVQTTPSEPVPLNTRMLLSTADPVADITGTKREHYDNGTYYYMDSNAENTVISISSCYQNSVRSDETEEDYATRRAIGMSAALTPGSPYNFAIAPNQALSDALGYEVYLASYFTGSELETLCWTVFLTRTEHYSYQYAFAAATEQGFDLEDTFTDYFATLKLSDLPK